MTLFQYLELLYPTIVFVCCQCEFLEQEIMIIESNAINAEVTQCLVEQEIEHLESTVINTELTQFPELEIRHLGAIAMNVEVTEFLEQIIDQKAFAVNKEVTNAIKVVMNKTDMTTVNVEVNELLCSENNIKEGQTAHNTEPTDAIQNTTPDNII
jgi:hypothetical protein